MRNITILLIIVATLIAGIVEAGSAASEGVAVKPAPESAEVDPHDYETYLGRWAVDSDLRALTELRGFEVSEDGSVRAQWYDFSRGLIVRRGSWRAHDGAILVQLFERELPLGDHPKPERDPVMEAMGLGPLTTLFLPRLTVTLRVGRYAGPDELTMWNGDTKTRFVRAEND